MKVWFLQRETKCEVVWGQLDLDLQVSANNNKHLPWKGRHMVTMCGHICSYRALLNHGKEKKMGKLRKCHFIIDIVLFIFAYKLQKTYMHLSVLLSMCFELR